MSEQSLKLVPSSDDASENDSSQTKERRSRRSRQFPANTLEQTLVIARAIADNNAGKPYSRLSLADSIGRSPDSSQFRTLITSSSAYGLTQGSYQATQIALTSLGASVVMPRNEQERAQALVQVAMKIELFQRLYEHFDQNRVPTPDNFRNTLIRDHGIDPSLANECVIHFKADGKLVGLIQNFSGVDRVVVAARAAQEELVNVPVRGTEDNTALGGGPVDAATLAGIVARTDSLDAAPATPTIQEVKNNRVFVSHGKNKKVVEQLKDILTFGKLLPIVAEEQETPSKPIPDKVMEAMRSCFAGVIHIEGEQKFIDNEGKVHHRVNENVLIEIGAAMALYQKNFILLARHGIELPSNLQGLYRCYYEGEKLDMEATMKLLKAFNEFS